MPNLQSANVDTTTNGQYRFFGDRPKGFLRSIVPLPSLIWAPLPHRVSAIERFLIRFAQMRVKTIDEQEANNIAMPVYMAGQRYNAVGPYNLYFSYLDLLSNHRILNFKNPYRPQSFSIFVGDRCNYLRNKDQTV